MLFLTRGGSSWRKAATAATATALAATTLAFAGAPAQADDEAQVQAPRTLKWNISAQYIDHFTPKVYAPDNAITGTDGATFADGQITFSNGVETVEGADTVLSYQGSVTGKFIVGGVQQYAVTVADPVITVDGEGDGSISAVVSAENIAAGGNPAAQTTPARATVAEFSGAAEADGVLTATPAFEGVLPADSEAAAELGIDAGKPVDGKSFHPEFLAQLTPGTRAHFYASGSGSDAKKPVASFSATSGPSVEATAAITGDFVEINVEGFNFDDSPRPGADGVYIGLAPVQDVTKVSAGGQEDGMAKFVASNWVPKNTWNNGSWVASATGDPAALIRGARYAVYTWTAHGNPTAGDVNLTETLVDLDTSSLPKNVAGAKVKVNKKPTSKKKGKLKVTVTGSEFVTATGKVKVALKKGKATKKANAKVNKKGVATIKLPKLAKGKWKLTVKYTGDANYKKATTKKNLKVKK